MIYIDQILVLRDPIKPEKPPYELTFDEVREFEEQFFRVGFQAEVILTDGTIYFCVKDEKGWEATLVDEDDDDFDENEYENPFYSKNEISSSDFENDTQNQDITLDIPEIPLPYGALNFVDFLGNILSRVNAQSSLN